MKDPNTDDREKHTHSHIKHMWMMAFFCGVPIIAFVAIGITGVSFPSLEIIILLICVIGMIGMTVIMHRDSDGKEKEHVSIQPEKGAHDETGK